MKIYPQGERNNMDLVAVIGLEIHVEMKTKSKMFSNAKVTFGEEPNTEVAILDMAFPGTMPSVNKQAVINAIRVCHALHMTIDNELWFDRKNYFYSDLPKGYQITQQDRPIGKDGYLTIDMPDGEKKIRIERLHMEEDTCKQLHSWDCSLLDYNRAGIPLIEIVSRPDISCGLEAAKYVEKIRSIVSFLEVSDGKMEEGSLRCDVNISLKERDSDILGTKVEIKNLNSLSNIEKAIDYEISRQTVILMMGNKVQQETRRFDEVSSETVLMRVKTDAVDYKYFTEPNIVPIKLSQEFIDNAINTSKELAEVKLARYKSFGLSDYDSNLLIAKKEASDYYDALTKNGANAKLAANWVIVDIQSYLNKNNLDFSAFPISSTNMAKLIKMIENNKCSNKQARELFAKMLDKDDDPERLFASSGISLISDETIILDWVNQILSANPSTIDEYKSGHDRVLGYLVGQVMKLSKGKANPALVNKILLQEVNKR